MLLSTHCICVLACERDGDRVLGTIRVERKWWHPEREGEGRALPVALWRIERHRNKEKQNLRTRVETVSQVASNKEFVWEQKGRAGGRRTEMGREWKVGKKWKEECWRESRCRRREEKGIRRDWRKQKMKSESWSDLTEETYESWPQNLVVSHFCGAGILISMFVC